MGSGSWEMERKVRNEWNRKINQEYIGAHLYRGGGLLVDRIYSNEDYDNK